MSTPTTTTAPAAPDQALAKRDEAALAAAGKSPIALGDHGLELRTLDDAFRFAKYVVVSGLAPKGLDTPEKVLIALQLGAEAGLRPMASLRNIVVINGMPSWKGDGALAMCRSSHLWKPLPGDTPWKGIKGEGEKMEAFVTTWRKGDPAPVTTTFSVQDAKTAGLWGKQGPWSQYPKRMLYYRALGFNLRDQFTDLLGGFPIAEEAADYPASVAEPSPVNAPPSLPGPGTPDPILAGVVVPTTAEPALAPMPAPVDRVPGEDDDIDDEPPAKGRQRTLG